MTPHSKYEKKKKKTLSLNHIDLINSIKLMLKMLRTTLPFA